MKESKLQKALGYIRHGGTIIGIASLAAPALANSGTTEHIDAYFDETNIISGAAALMIAAGIGGMALKAEQIENETKQEFSRLKSLAAFTGDSQMRFEHLLENQIDKVDDLMQLVQELQAKIDSEQ